MVNRLLNTELTNEKRSLYLSLLEYAVRHFNATDATRNDASRFLSLQLRGANERIN
jgi:hypothetical protein